jgi:glucose 1-dehydrogenase
MALVTGGDQGIGRGIALRFAQEGADVAIGFRSNKQGADGTVSDINKLGVRGIAIQGDVSKIAEGQNVVTEAIKQLGRIDILVNNAGLERHADFWDVTEQDFDLVLDVNLKGVFFITQSAVRHWIGAKRPGKVVNISSVHEELPFPHFASYCASKGGLKMLTRNLAIELAPFGITINNIAPGAIETPINTKLLNTLAMDEYIPVIAPIGVGENGESFNINADTVAGEIAAALSAEKLMFLTDIDGIRTVPNDPSTLIYEISIDEIYKYINTGVITGGMLPKVEGCIKAIQSGVKRTHILNGTIPHPILLEIFTDTGIGTMVRE